jgi:hypothetical protein
MNRFALWALLLVGGFLAGFVPQYARNARLDAELRDAAARNRRAEVRDLAALAHIQALQKNFGLAGQTASQFFDRARDLAAAADENQRRALHEALAQRDAVTAALAKGDAAAVGQLQELVLKVHAATR